jgi:hypothetical protein
LLKTIANSPSLLGAFIIHRQQRIYRGWVGSSLPNDWIYYLKKHCSKNIKSPLNLHTNQHLHCFSSSLILILHPPLFTVSYLRVMLMPRHWLNRKSFIEHGRIVVGSYTCSKINVVSISNQSLLVEIITMHASGNPTRRPWWHPYIRRRA